jgi:hypothetical protein
VQEAQAALCGPSGEPREDAGVLGVTFVDPGAVADEGDVPMARVGEMVCAQGPRGREVVVHAGQLVRVVRQADVRGLRALLPQHRDVRGVELDVHEDHAVRETARRDAPHALRAVVARDQQDVVPVTAGGRGDGDGDLRHDRAVHVAAQRHDQSDDVRAVAPGRLGHETPARRATSAMATMVVSSASFRSAGGATRDSALRSESVEALHLATQGNGMFPVKQGAQAKRDFH